MLKKIGITILIIAGMLSIAIYFSYSEFKEDRLNQLVSNSQIASTSLGDIEYKIFEDSGPLVLFLHGTPGGYDQAAPMKGFRVLAPSRPGYLRTTIDIGRSPAEQARAYLALLDELNIDKVIVMGVSGGGPSAISFASLYPDRTNALVLIEAVSQSIVIAGDDQLPFFMNYDFSLWAVLSLMTNLMEPEQLIAQLVPDIGNRQLILANQEILDKVAELIWSSWPVSKREVGTQNDFAQFANLILQKEKITVPTLLVHGTADKNVPYAQSEKLASQIPHAILHPIEGGDHFMPFTHSDELELAVEKFGNGVKLDE